MVEGFDLESLPGVGPKAAEKLKNAGYIDLMSIATASPSEIAVACEIGEATAMKIIEAARKELKMGFETASEIFNRRKTI
jgi:DNA repair protein RadA